MTHTRTNSRRSTISNSTINTSPSINRSTINECKFDNLGPADSISRSELQKVTVFTRSSPSPDATPCKGIPTTIHKSNVSNSTISNTYASRSTITNCTLGDDPSAKIHQAVSCMKESIYVCRSEMQNSSITDRSSLSKSEVHGSVVKGHSSLSRSEVRDSTVKDGTSLRRSKLEGTQVSRSHVRRAVLEDCDVRDCVIFKTDFKGMVLRNGVWKNGKLVGKMGQREVIAVSRDEKPLDPSDEEANPQDPKQWLDSGSDTSQESVKSEELPPYRP